MRRNHTSFSTVCLLLLFHCGLTSCSGKPYVIKPVNKANEPRNITIYVSSHGWHTGIIVPAEPMNRQLPFLATEFGKTRYYEFGWGDRKFYQAPETGPWLTVQAALWPTSTVMHVVAIPGDPVRYYVGTTSKVASARITASQFVALQRFIKNSFARNRQGHARPINKGLYGNSRFYPATGRFHALNTCNRWTAKGLKSAGMDIDPPSMLRAEAIMKFMRKFPHK